MPETLTLPNTPKIHLARYLAQGKDDTPCAPVEVTAPTAVTVAHPVKLTQNTVNGLDSWLLEAPQQVTTIDVPAGFQADTPIVLRGPATGGGVIQIHVGEDAHVVLQERWQADGDVLGVGVWLTADAGATVDWLTYDAFIAPVAVVQRTVDLGAGTTLNWTIAGFSHNSGASLATVNLNGLGAHATINVGVLASGRQHVGYVTAVTNQAQKTVGHINQHGVITDKAHLIFNGIGHIVKGARGSDAQQENRVLMLNQDARGDANPILLIDENDVTAGHAASVTRVDARQMYYLMSRGLQEALAKRLVIRGFLEAGLGEIADPELKQELFDTIDETLVNADA
ncbi:SufD family Fe-S cluster assembly protein [Lacticaseibacillus yichunensis]|uniref:SufD family Fe-S cluster assembly protein n=1 Tax=Lacticaseibacillus yichunensis TaxID=2486015 RepID=A0ABW4CQT0_9LACO|nr:SufD family Fe-S cluster assembly protein [Lacticaseibacillus yichunensis]